MLRSEVIQSLTALFSGCRYLEVGVNAGLTFHAVNCAHKTAVEPKFLFDYQSMQKENVVYHEKFSDEFFRTTVGPKTRYDVIFLDGLHQFEQTLRDLMNSVNHVSDDGIIVVDDVIPSDYPASLYDPTEMLQMRRRVGDAGGAWMGDVYKLVYFIQAFMPHWSVATVAENHGQLVMWRQPRNPMPMRVRDIVEKDYSHVALNNSSFNIMPLADILARVKSARSGA